MTSETNNIPDDGRLEEEVIIDTPDDSEVSEEVEQSEPDAVTKSNVTLSYNPRKEVPENNREEFLGIVSLNSETLPEYVGSQSFKANGKSLSEEYVTALQHGMELVFSDDVIQRAINNAGHLDQHVEYDDKKLMAGVPVYNSKSGDILSGIKAVSQMQRALGQGSFLTFPCWASGVWLTIRAPTTFELADYYDAVAEEIIDLGKQTGGATHGNTSVYLTKFLIELIEKLIHKCSIKGFMGSGSRLRDILIIDDLQTVAWALGVAMYPNGYPFEEPCTVDIEKCTHVHKTLLNISKMYFVDKSRLTNWQVEFMSNKTIERSMDEIKKYQLESDWLHSESIDYPGFKILIKTPTVGEYIDAGYRWIANIEQSIRNTISNISNVRLNELIMERAGLTLLRGYAHYVKSFIYSNGAVVNNLNDIDEVINTLCTSPEIVEKFTDDIQSHIAKSTISMIAIPRHTCPECGKDSHVEETTHPHLIPVDGIQLFFALRDQKLRLA